jgi:hypothetical protein
MKEHTAAFNWVTFLGIFMLLIGLFATVRTVVNIYVLPQYPQSGVLAFSLGGTQTYYQRESDCNYPPTLSYGPDGKPSAPSPEQNKIDEQNKANCLAGVKDNREQTKVNDIATAAMFLFVGGGLLFIRRFFFQSK